VRELRVDGTATRVIPFPHAHRTIVRILTSPASEGPYESLDVLLLRRTFDQLADSHGASRIKRLDLHPGMAADDIVMRHLGACLEHALEPANPASPAAVDQITASLNVHIAQRYGDLQPAQPPQSGGLATWQLRLAWTAFDRYLDGSVSLDNLARECGLSASHFSRAFRRSTGLAPHRWLMQRRVEVAKDLMLADAAPLAQIAVACGFADQSHFTRTFASVSGLTPGRWRISQERELAPA
jgi:AraC-like DNA-binding protein